MKAINLGMFLHENKLDLVGLLNSSTIKNSTAPTAVKANKTSMKKKPETSKADEQDGILDTGGIFNTTSSVNTENIFNTAPVSATIEHDDELPL